MCCDGIEKKETKKQKNVLAESTRKVDYCDSATDKQ
jgi:hypothetical protein